MLVIIPAQKASDGEKASPDSLLKFSFTKRLNKVLVCLMELEGIVTLLWFVYFLTGAPAQLKMSSGSNENQASSFN